MLTVQKDGPDGYSAVFEDDGKVAYAYLLEDGRIVGDVWLYNAAPTPDEPEWRDRSKAPFLNPRRFASAEPFRPATEEADVDLSWTKDPEGNLILRISLHGAYHAMLTPGSKPGWCRLAVNDGPLASVLT